MQRLKCDVSRLLNILNFFIVLLPILKIEAIL